MKATSREIKMKEMGSLNASEKGEKSVHRLDER